MITLLKTFSVIYITISLFITFGFSPLLLITHFMSADEVGVLQVTASLQLHNTVIFALPYMGLVISGHLSLLIQTEFAGKLWKSCSSVLLIVCWFRSMSPGTEFCTQSQHSPCTQSGQSGGLIVEIRREIKIH